MKPYLQSLFLVRLPRTQKS